MIYPVVAALVIYFNRSMICKEAKAAVSMQSMKFLINIDCFGTYDVE